MLKKLNCTKRNGWRNIFQLIRFNHKYISNMTGYKKYVREAEFHQYAKKKKVKHVLQCKISKTLSISSSIISKVTDFWRNLCVQGTLLKINTETLWYSVLNTSRNRCLNTVLYTIHKYKLKCDHTEMQNWLKKDWNTVENCLAVINQNLNLIYYLFLLFVFFVFLNHMLSSRIFFFSFFLKDSARRCLKHLAHHEPKNTIKINQYGWAARILYQTKMGQHFPPKGPTTGLLRSKIFTDS